MALGADELNEIEKMLSASESGPSPVTELRGRFPHLKWIRCDASDVLEAPFRSYARVDLHLLDGSDHCVQITTDPARATGLVLAVRSVA